MRTTVLPIVWWLSDGIWKPHSHLLSSSEVLLLDILSFHRTSVRLFCYERCIAFRIEEVRTLEIGYSCSRPNVDTNPRCLSSCARILWNQEIKWTKNRTEHIDRNSTSFGTFIRKSNWIRKKAMMLQAKTSSNPKTKIIMTTQINTKTKPSPNRTKKMEPARTHNIIQCKGAKRNSCSNRKPNRFVDNEVLPFHV